MSTGPSDTCFFYRLDRFFLSFTFRFLPRSRTRVHTCGSVAHVRGPPRTRNRCDSRRTATVAPETWLSSFGTSADPKTPIRRSSVSGGRGERNPPGPHYFQTPVVCNFVGYPLGSCRYRTVDVNRVQTRSLRITRKKKMYLKKKIVVPISS